MTDETDERDRRARLRVVGAAGTEAGAVGSAGDPDTPVDLMDPADRAVGDEAVGDRAADDGPDGESANSESTDDVPETQEWAWITEWRESAEPAPWATGLPLAAFAAVLAGVAIWVLSAGLADRPVLAVVLNVLVAGGLVPAMWLSRHLPVLRWFAAGAAVGVAGGWIAALMML